MRFSHEEQALLDAIHVDPKSDVPRLAYADWLTGRGVRRGEFIRIQCTERRLQWISTDCNQNFGRVQPKSWESFHYPKPPWPEPGWHRPMPSPLVLSGFYRGLAMLYLPPVWDWTPTPKEWDRIYRKVTPAARLSVYLPYDENFEAYIRHPLMGRVTALDVAGYLMATNDVKVLAKCPHLQRISSLNMRNLDPEGEVAFAELIKPVLPSASSSQVVNANGVLYSMDTIDRMKGELGR